MTSNGRPSRSLQAVGQQLSAAGLQAEEVLLKAGALQNAIFNSANFSSIATDAKGVIQIFNVGAEKMLGYTAAEVINKITGCSRDELIGAPFKGFFTDPERAEAGIKLVLSQKKVIDYELTACAVDGRKTVVSNNATTFYSRDRTLQGVFAAARDVTEGKRVEAELKQAKANAESASRTKSEFLASMSHEIRTPMNAIMGIADLLAQTSFSLQQTKYVQIFQRAGDNLLNLINDILDLSKVEASQLELEQTGFSLKDLLEKVTEMVAARAQEKALVLVCEVDPAVPNELVGDPTRLRQVLMNLVGNAIKFTEAGEVALRVTWDGDASVPTSLRFTVSDTGIGVPEQQLSRVFERFTQADSSTTRRFGGSGLGLTISKRLVELMGGRLWVESSVGKGSVFCFAAPFEVWVEAARHAPLPVGTGLPEALPPLHILLAEDSPDNCTITLAYLEGTPYRLDIAETGAMACEMFAANHYDLVLMDRQMPVMDGLTATRRIRAMEKEKGRPPTPIIALTASALKGDREKCMAAGCTAFLTKPIKQEVLLQAIKDHSLAVSPAPPPERIPANPTLPLHPAVAARIPAFLENRRRDVIAMQAALARDDFETVGRLGHGMKGAGASFGFQAITDIGAGLEEEAGRSDPAASSKWVRELSTYLARLEPAPGEDLGHATESLVQPPASGPIWVTAVARSESRPAASGSRRIVIVEDNDDARECFRALLEQSGHQVRDARDGLAGLALILAEEPDVAFVDLGLPCMDGNEVARRVRAEIGDSVLLVTMTGRGKESDRAKSFAAGFDLHLTKPVEFEEVDRILGGIGSPVAPPPTR